MMNFNNFPKLTFHSLCIFTAFSMFIFVSIRFYNDDSMTVIDFQTYHNRKQDIYPSISFCLSMDNPYVGWYDTSLALYEPTKTKQNTSISSREGLEDFIKFLQGNNSDSKLHRGITEMIGLNYDDVTVNLGEYLKMIKVESAESLLYEWPKNSHFNPMITSYRHALLKCISLDLLDEVIPEIKGRKLFSVEFQFHRNNSIFDENSDLQMGIFMHYPHQLLRAIKLDHEDLGLSHKTYQSNILIDNIEIIRRRNTRTRKCNENYLQDDETILRALAKKVGCHPIHWLVNKNYTTKACNNVRQMKKLLTPSMRFVSSKFLKPYPWPCQQIQSISYTKKSHHSWPPNSDNFLSYFDGSPGPPRSLKDSFGHPPPLKKNSDAKETPELASVNKSFDAKETNRFFVNPKNNRIQSSQQLDQSIHDSTNDAIVDTDSKTYRFVFQSPNYKEIIHVQAFNFEHWMGNVGGYIGSILGFSVWQCPDFFEFLYRKTRNIIII